MQGDAVVNSTDPGLEHGHGQVSKVLLEKLGDDLLKQCKERYPKGLRSVSVCVQIHVGVLCVCLCV